MTWRVAEPYSGSCPDGFILVTNQPGPEGFPFYLNTSGHWAFMVERNKARSVVRELNSARGEATR